MNVIELKEKIVTGEELTPQERDLVLQCINEAVGERAQLIEMLCTEIERLMSERNAWATKAAEVAVAGALKT